jgi:hypothetical protein
MKTDERLPAEFADLEAFGAWALETETERNHHRIASTQDEIESFAGAMLPRLDAIALYLKPYPLDGMPAQARRLFCMLLSVAEVAPCYEGYRQPTVPDGYDSRLFRAQEDFPRRPRI